MTNEISLVTVPVDYYLTAVVAQRQDVRFRIFQQDDWFKAVPLLSTEERQMSGLPEELVFVCVNHAIVAANHMEDETLTVIKQIIMELEVQELL